MFDSSDEYNQSYMRKIEKTTIFGNLSIFCFVKYIVLNFNKLNRIAMILKSLVNLNDLPNIDY